MPYNPTMSILGLYNFKPDLFDGMVLPDEVDRDTMINYIVLECSELDALYSNGDFMAPAIGIWSKARLLTWTRLAEVLTKDYDPFVNIKRDEVRTTTQTRDLTTTNEGKQVNKTNAYDSGVDTQRSTADVDNTQKDTGNVVTIDNLHIEGDSAITDAQDVMRKEVEVREDYDIYKYICNDFKRSFCLRVY